MIRRKEALEYSDSYRYFLNSTLFFEKRPNNRIYINTQAIAVNTNSRDNKNTSHMMPHVIYLLITPMVRNVKGFTMVELMIVIAIIGVLAVALIPSLLGSQAKARDTARQNNLNSIASAIDGYQLDNSAFPDLVSGQANCVSDSNGKVSNFSTAINATIAANIK